MAPAWNGGPTKTMALTGTSPARDIGTTSGAPAIDQRGVLRDGTPDLGAYEFSTDVIFADGFEP
ncbi:MAG TPA: choice-of-anchor Q domain-containing protein [Vicinamibacteria bacterium]|nr:choice-of-anchor Q domain-containing protein [Vicinamibacteria bacterium]